MFHLKISYIISLETPIFECKKILLKSWEKEYLQIESDGIQVNTAGKRSSMTSTFILHRVSETSVTLRSFKSGRILTAASSGYRLQEDSNTVQNVNHFKIINEMDGKISLQTNDNKFMTSGGNGQVIGMDTLSENGKWSFECFRGIRLVYHIAMLLVHKDYIYTLKLRCCLKISVFVKYELCHFLESDEKPITAMLYKESNIDSNLTSPITYQKSIITCSNDIDIKNP